MKKNALAIVLSGVFVAMTTGVQAASVQVYGLIDTSIVYEHSDPDVAGQKATNKLTMENAQQFGSRFGLRGSEDLGNGLKLGFTLESGFKSDTGELDQNGRLFGRESSISLSGQYGTVWAGLLPIFGSTLGANGLFRAIDPVTANYTTAFGTGAATAGLMTRVDNAIAYRTPTIAGFTGYAMYSFKMNNKASDTNEQIEGKSSSDRYASLAVRYQAGALEGVLVADTTDWGNKSTGTNHNDGWTVTLGGNYTLDNGLKLLAFYQQFENQLLNTKARAGVGLAGIEAIAGTNSATNKANGYGYVTGWGAGIGANYPFAGGVARVALNHREMDNELDVDFTRTTVGTAFDYPLSKRTALYTMAGWSQEKVENHGVEATPNGWEAMVGMVHRF